MARTLAINGASKIFILGRREPNLLAVQASLPAPYNEVIVPVVGDVTCKESLKGVYEVVAREVGEDGLDVVVCNSGVTGPRIVTGKSATSGKEISVEELAENMLRPSEGELTDTYAVNLTGIHLTVATFLPLLAKANAARVTSNSNSDSSASTSETTASGTSATATATTRYRPRPQIITTASIGAYNRIPLGSMTYGPSKAGVIHLTKQLASLLVPHDIRANVIAPGLYYSEMTAGMYQARGVEGRNEEGSWPKDVIPAGRGGEEADIGGVVLWLCSRAGAYVNGCVVVSDGGRLGVVPSSY